MSEAAVIDAFPRRPLAPVIAPDRGRKRLMALIAILLGFLPGIYWAVQLHRDEGLRADLLARGIQAQVLSAESDCVYKRTLVGDTPKSCNMDITYQVRPQEGGGTRGASVFFYGSPPIFTPPALYDPQEPGRVMLEPEARRPLGWKEYIGIPIALLFPVLFLLGWLATIKSGLDAYAASPRPVVVPVTKAQQAVGGDLSITYTAPGGKTGGRLFKPGSGPLMVSAPGGQMQALALLSEKGASLIFRGDLSEFDFTDSERAAIQWAAQAV